MGPGTDVVDVAVLMSDFNLITIPVVDERRRMIGIITVDDVLETTLPADWRRREGRTAAGRPRREWLATGDDGEPQPEAVQQPAGQQPEARPTPALAPQQPGQHQPSGQRPETRTTPGRGPSRGQGPAPAKGPPLAKDSVPPGQMLARPSAVLDQAHLGDIEGALGRIRVGEELRGGWRRRLITF